MTRKQTSRTAVQALAYIFLTLGALSMLVPFLWMLTTSLKSEAEAFIFPPRPFGEKILWTNYLKVSDRFSFARYFFNSAAVSAWVVFFQLLTSAMAGFVFARLRFRFREKIFLLYLATMMVPGHVTVITNYINLSKLGLTGSLWPLMIPPMVSAFGTFLLRQFFVTIPQSLDDAARIDGCNPFMIFFRIFLPWRGRHWRPWASSALWEAGTITLRPLSTWWMSGFLPCPWGWPICRACTPPTGRS